MKKIMILAACVMLAAVTQAAAVGWNCAGATAFGGGSYSVFVVGLNGFTGADQIKSIIAAGGLSKADSYAFYKGGSIQTNGAIMLANTTSGKSIAYNSDGDAAANTYQAVIFVESADKKSASFTGIASITLENDSTGRNFGFSNQATAFGNNSFTVNTPEPTSGVLLLLGMAGLALKRKRA